MASSSSRSVAAPARSTLTAHTAEHEAKVANTAAASWKFTHLKGKTDKDDTQQIIQEK